MKVKKIKKFLSKIKEYRNIIILVGFILVLLLLLLYVWIYHPNTFYIGPERVTIIKLLGV